MKVVGVLSIKNKRQSFDRQKRLTKVYKDSSLAGCKDRTLMVE